MKKKKEEEAIKKQNKEEELRLKEEEKIKKNDNVNLINDFKCEKINNMEYIMTISNSFPTINNIAVYTIIRNNKIYYEIAYQENYSNDRFDNTIYQPYNISIYNILSNTITNRIKQSYNYYNLKDIKHYYHSLSKKHFLLTSAVFIHNNSNYDQSDKCYYYNKVITINLWNISSNIISNEVSIDKNLRAKILRTYNYKLAFYLVKMIIILYIAQRKEMKDLIKKENQMVQFQQSK